MTDALRQELKRWGFSDAETEVYLAVLETDQARVSEVAERADVTSRHVYRIAERLEERGLVAVDDHLQPTVLRATPPDEVAAIMDSSHGTILEEIEARFAEPSNPIGNVEILNHKPAVLERCRSMMENAEEWLLLVARWDLVADLADDLAAATERGILTLVVTEDEADVDGRALGDIASVVRIWDDLETWDEAGLGADYFESLYVIPDEEGASAGSFSPAVYVEQRNLTPRITASLLGNEWRLGEEISVPEPVELPHTFDSFATSLVHAALHRRDGVSLRATVEGQSTDTGERETLSGDVVDVLQGMVEPARKTFSLERVLSLDTGEEEQGEVSIASPGATIEDYVAHSITLERAADDEDDA